MARTSGRAALAAIMRLAEERRARRNRELAPLGVMILHRRDLMHGHVVLSGAWPHEEIFTVEQNVPARARRYRVQIGRDRSGAEYRTSGHEFDEVYVRREVTHG